MATWKELLEEQFKANGEDFTKMVTTLSKDDLEKNFDPGYGGTKKKPFTAWGLDYVYFPVQYDGAEWVESVPRNPCKEVTCHVGGG